MSYQTNEDNIYAVGTFITAREAPTIRLQITKYYQRIYYCCIVGNETAKQKAYFERELIAPVQPWIKNGFEIVSINEGKIHKTGLRVEIYAEAVGIREVRCIPGWNRIGDVLSQGVVYISQL